MYKASLSEKIGALLERGIVRFLIGVAVTALGSFLGIVCSNAFLNFLGLILMLCGICLIISTVKSAEYSFVTGVFVRLQSGGVVPCVIVKKESYVYAAFLFQFLCLFRYIPYRTEYFLVKNILVPGIASGTKISGKIIEEKVFNVESITKAKQNAIVANPQIIEPGLCEQIANVREKFVLKAKKFIDSGILEEIWFSDKLSICRLYSGEYMIFHYGNGIDNPFGYIVTFSDLEKIKISSEYLFSPDFERVATGTLNDNTYYRLCNLIQLKNQNNSNIALTEENKANQENYLNNLNQNKKCFTHEMVCNQTEKNYNLASVLIGFGIYFGLFLFVTSIFAVESVIGKVIFGLLAVVFIAVMCRYLVKRSKKRKQFQGGAYRVIKSICLSVERVESEGEAGTTVTYVHRFANGKVVSAAKPVGNVGDIFYLICPAPDYEVKTFFNGRYYYPDPRFIVEDGMPRG